MSFVPGIPASGQSLGSSRPQVNGNFGALASAIATNHIGVNLTGVGKHNLCELVVQGSDPTAALNEISLYSKTIAGATELFLKRDTAGSVIQMSVGTPIAANNGTTFLPGGVIVKWFRATVSGITPPAITYSSAGVGNFPNACFGALISNNTDSESLTILATTTQVQIAKSSSTSNVNVFVVVIGN